MGLSKKRLREIVVKDIAENGLNWVKVRFSSHLIPPIAESIVKGRRIRSLPSYLSRDIDYYSRQYMRNKGFEIKIVRSRYEKADPEGTVRIKIFSESNKHTWVLMPKDTALKILILGVVPDFT